MKKTFRLEGLDCANCAMKIENAVKKIEGVDEASVNFMTTKLSIRADRENMPEILKETEKTVKQLEPDVDMVKA
ncbi:cation transporter [Vagococcus humatus]|uniref:cation transporter n=1 Tax=Vagococcus humatus TaxID=1889241 RepID=UPI002696D61A